MKRHVLVDEFTGHIRIFTTAKAGFGDHLKRKMREEYSEDRDRWGKVCDEMITN